MKVKTEKIWIREKIKTYYEEIEKEEILDRKIDRKKKGIPKLIYMSANQFRKPLLL